MILANMSTHKNQDILSRFEISHYVQVVKFIGKLKLEFFSSLIPCEAFHIDMCWVCLVEIEKSLIVSIREKTL